MRPLPSQNFFVWELTCKQENKNEQGGMKDLADHGESSNDADGQ